MTAADVLAALALPEAARVDRRVPKKLLMDNGAPTATDRRQIADGIASLAWVAALKPTTIGVPSFKNAVRAYLEVAVLRMELRARARADRLVALVHRAIPYPVLLVTEVGGWTRLSVAHIRWSQAHADRTVLEDGVVSTDLTPDPDPAAVTAFGSALALSTSPKQSLFALYQVWLDAIVALNVWRVTGVFALPASPEHASARRQGLSELANLERTIGRLRSSVTRETQMARQVDMNLELKRLRAARAAAEAML